MFTVRDIQCKCTAFCHYVELRPNCCLNDLYSRQIITSSQNKTKCLQDAVGFQSIDWWQVWPRFGKDGPKKNISFHSYKQNNPPGNVEGDQSPNLSSHLLRNWAHVTHPNFLHKICKSHLTQDLGFGMLSQSFKEQKHPRGGFELKFIWTFRKVNVEGLSGPACGELKTK